MRIQGDWSQDQILINDIDSTQHLKALYGDFTYRIQTEGYEQMLIACDLNGGPCGDWANWYLKDNNKTLNIIWGSNPAVNIYGNILIAINWRIIRLKGKEDLWLRSEINGRVYELRLKYINP